MVLALALCKRDNVEVTVYEKGPSHLASSKFNPDRSYTIDMTGHGAKALGKVYDIHYANDAIPSPLFYLFMLSSHLHDGKGGYDDTINLKIEQRTFKL